MNGVQFYLKRDVHLSHGHQLYVDSQWALTSISQHQFWQRRFDFEKFGDGQVRGILSVDLSEWDHPGGLIRKPARDCTREEIRQEVWWELKQSLNVGGKKVLRDEDLHDWHLDDDIVPCDPVTGRACDNMEPLLVNEVDTWRLRPQTRTGIPNLLLASDYVRTNTDLATMEGANEAARRAVNAILNDALDAGLAVDQEPCRIWDLEEPGILDLWKRHDRDRYFRGLPWDGGLSLWPLT
jgi:uncharacterized protein with NAD-binding domain and iron-sulfur cluster